jgi:chaperone BCS1
MLPFLFGYSGLEAVKAVGGYVIREVKNATEYHLTLTSTENAEIFQAVLIELSCCSPNRVSMVGDLDHPTFVYGYGKLELEYKFEDETTLQLSVNRERTDQGELLTLVSRVSQAGQLKRVVQLAIDKYRAATRNKVMIYTPLGDCWEPRTQKERRDPASIILPHELGERLLASVSRFFESKAIYRDRGIPYRRGYLFHGPPGCGKSSFVLALASHFGLPIYMLNMASETMSDSVLERLLLKLPEGSLLLLEDIDAVQYNREAADDAPARFGRSSVTLSGLLNSLDGVAAYENSILVCTTNHMNRLDGALMRSGRIDELIEFPLPDPHMAGQLFLRFGFPPERLAVFKQDFAAACQLRHINMADLQGLFMSSDPRGLTAIEGLATCGKVRAHDTTQAPNGGGEEEDTRAGSKRKKSDRRPA